MLRARGHRVFDYIRENKEINLDFPARIALRSIWSNEDYRAIRGLIRSNQIDIVHVHNFLPLISPAAFHAAHDEGVPVVHTLHNYRLACSGAQLFRSGTICEDCVGKSLPWPGVVHGCYRNSRVATAGVAAILTTHRILGTWTKKVSAYIVLNKFMRSKLAGAGLPPDKIFLKSNFAPDLGVGVGRGGYAFFAGRLSREKGILTLLAAWEKLVSKLPLKIAGAGPLEDLVRAKAGQFTGVEFLGALRPEEVHERMADAVALIVPSEWYEGAPMVIVEALSKGTPVIASNLGGLPEMIDHQRSGLLFNAGNSASLQEAVGRLLEPGFCAHLREGARDKFLAEYTEEQNYRLLTGIYRALVPQNDAMECSV
jgi:glycosyltransferase involved in cell wall biosynthesis